MVGTIEIGRPFRLGMIVCLSLAAAATLGDAVNARPKCVFNDARQQSAAAVVREAARSGFAGTVVVEGCGRLLVDAAEGWADARHKRPADGDTLYHVASVTKLVTAIAMLKLAEEGRLSLTDTVARSFPDAPADKAAITVEQLLLHQSGLGQNYAADGHTERDEAVRAIFATPLAFPPGTGQKYSNDGMNLLAAIAEKATGEPYAALVRRRVLAPAGLERTLFWEQVVPGRTANVAVPPHPSDDAPKPGRNWGMMGGDGLWSNARELARLMRTLMQGKVLGAASLAALTKARLDAGDGDFTNYGWFTRVEANKPLLLWARGTEQDGFNAALYWYPNDDLIIAIASNVGPFESERVTVSRALALRLEKALLW
jgi:CubicO group peptidase (beta-lactamase class C family)